MDPEDLERRHAALIERDRWVGLEAEVASARAYAARLEARLEVAQQRLDRKNARIKALADRLAAAADHKRTSAWRARVSRLSEIVGR